MIRAKFICTSVLKTIEHVNNLVTGKYEPKPVFRYKFQAVSSGSEENKQFFASTPSGSIELAALREDLFELNQEYYIDFSIPVVLPSVVEEATPEATPEAPVEPAAPATPDAPTA